MTALPRIDMRDRIVWDTARVVSENWNKALWEATYLPRRRNEVAVVRFLVIPDECGAATFDGTPIQQADALASLLGYRPLKLYTNRWGSKVFPWELSEFIGLMMRFDDPRHLILFDRKVISEFAFAEVRKAMTVTID